VNYISLLETASFKPVSLAQPNAWVGHLPFAAWLIKTIQPGIFVELGTHTGNSYFSFCQAIEEAKLATKCYSVDTWQGEEHAGYYDESVYQQVNTHNQQNYAHFSSLLRMTFDEAASLFENKSVQLLHIDGLHTYEAVRHDFETWLPKLAPGAIVLFHDTNVRERGFGVWKLWEELQERYPNNLEFIHSHGLGVLQLDGGAEDKRQEWLKPSEQTQKRLKDYFSALGARQQERFEFGRLRDEFKDELSAYRNQADEFARQVSALQAELAGILTQHEVDLSSLKFLTKQTVKVLFAVIKQYTLVYK